MSERMKEEARDGIIMALCGDCNTHQKNHSCSSAGQDSEAEGCYGYLVDAILAHEGDDWKLRVLGEPSGVTNKDGEMLIPGDIPPDCFIFFITFKEWA